MYGKKITATVLTILLVFAMLPVQVLAGEELLTEDFISDEIDVIDGDPEIEDIQEENLNADGFVPEEDGLTPDGDGDVYTLILNLDYNEGGTSQPQPIEGGSKYELPLYTNVRQGYTHIGWCTKAALDPNGSGNGINYNPGTVITLTDHLTLYAKWEKDTENKHTVRICANGGFGTYMEPKQVYDNSEYTVPDCQFLYDKSCFMGWALTAEGEPVYEPGDKIKVNENITLFAKFTNNEMAFDGITRVDNGGCVYLGGIKWKMIGEDADRWFLISSDFLAANKSWQEAKDYCVEVYKSCNFYERKLIGSAVKTDSPANENYHAADLTGEKMFLLSAYEANTYFASTDARLPGGWWLRSLYGQTSNNAAKMGNDGRLNFDAISDRGFGNQEGYCRPAFILNRTSVLFSSAAAGGKSSATAGGGEFGAFRATSEDSGDLKLTILGSSAQMGFTANADKTTVASGGNLSVTYDKAVTGNGYYVSAMLCDSDKNIIGYASLTPDSSGKGTWNMTLPSGLTDGATYTLKVFNEQQNGDNETDYASPLSEITLTVEGVARSDQTITASDFTKTYGDKAFKINAKTDGDGSLSYSSDKTSVAAVDGNGTVTIKGAGEANITITASETANYNSATKKIKITVNKAAQSITASDVTKTMGDASFSLGAKASGGGKLTYTSGNTSVVTVDANGTVTVKGVGKTTIKIDAAETANYKSATKTINVMVNAAAATEYTVKATTDGNGTATASPKSGTTGTEVKLTATANNGYEFKEWTVVSGGVSLADPKKASTTFKIKNANVEVKALFKQKTHPTPDPKKTDISGATVTLSKKSLTYKDKAQKPTVKSVTLGKKTLTLDKDYTVSYQNKSSKNVGTYKITVSGIGKYTGSVSATYKIKQASNPMKVSLKKKELNVKLKKLKNKDQTISRSTYLTVSKAQGDVTYTKTSGDKKITVNSKNGKITISKKLKKGTYSIKVSVKAEGNDNYKASTAKKVKVRIVVK